MKISEGSEIELGYGHGVRNLSIPPGVAYETVRSEPLTPLPDPAEAVRTALRDPVGSAPLHEIVGAGERVAVIVNDVTRMVRSDIFLPVLIDELNAAGVPDRDIFIVFAQGTHRRQTVEEQRNIVGPAVASRVALYQHDCRDRENLVYIGTTTRGNEIRVNLRVYEADRVIMTGEIIHHLIAGYSGGRKSILPGVAGFDTIIFNHRFLLDPNCRIGVLDGNPVHEDMVEACRMLDPDFLLDVILDARGELVGVVAGHYESAHQQGCELADRAYNASVSEPYDVVVASAGGFPFDIDLRQAHKGMENAARALKPGGSLLYFAECEDGTGFPNLEEWVRRFPSLAETERELRANFALGPHKVYWLMRLSQQVKVHLVSSLPDDLVRRCQLIPVRDANETFSQLLVQNGPGTRIGIMPYSSITFPRLIATHEARESEGEEVVTANI